MGVRERLVCDDCFKQSGVAKMEETTLGILVPQKCTICGTEMPPAKLHQPRDDGYRSIRHGLGLPNGDSRS